MKFIEEFRDIHKGKEIWILGSGKSLDDFPDNFFHSNNRISIACNRSAWGFPECTYYCWWHKIYNDMAMIQDPNIFKKCILAYPVENWSLEDWREYIHYPILFNWEVNIYRREQLVYNVRQIMTKQPCRYGGMGTTIQAALQIAAVLGASKITLVGCEHKWEPEYDYEKSYCKKVYPYLYWTKEKIDRYKEFTKDPSKFLQNMDKFIQGIHIFSERIKCDKGIHQNEVFGFAQLNLRGTWYFAEEFKRYGVEVSRYYHGEGYRRIVEEDGVEHWDVGQYEEWCERYPLPEKLEGLTLNEIREGKTNESRNNRSRDSR